MITKAQIGEWLSHHSAETHSHMLVVTDSWDYDDYPVYVQRGESLDVKLAAYSINMQHITEIYSYDLSLDAQLAEPSAWHANPVRLSDVFPFGITGAECND